jgi:hypothetical protein
MRFYDNLDPRTLGRALGGLDLETTRFILTSKSGNTPETLVQAIAAIKSFALPDLRTGLLRASRSGEPPAWHIEWLARAV